LAFVDAVVRYTLVPYLLVTVIGTRVRLAARLRPGAVIAAVSRRRRRTRTSHVLVLRLLRV